MVKEVKFLKEYVIEYMYIESFRFFISKMVQENLWPLLRFSLFTAWHGSCATEKLSSFLKIQICLMGDYWKKILFVFSENYAEYNNSHVVPFEPKRSELRLYLPRVLFYSCSLSSHINRIISICLQFFWSSSLPYINCLFLKVVYFLVLIKNSFWCTITSSA